MMQGYTRFASADPGLEANIKAEKLGMSANPILARRAPTRNVCQLGVGEHRVYRGSPP